MRKTALIAASFLVLGGAANAADAPGLSVTIYNANLALVRDARQLDIAAGRQTLEFKDVSSAIRPETVALSADGVSIVEQNFDYDLLTPEKLMEKAVGKQVQIVRTNPGNGAQVTETATVLAANEGVVLKIGDRIEVLRDDGIPTRVIFDKVPDNLRAEPTLSVVVDSDHGGSRVASLSYLTTGLSWKADYVALFDETAAKLDLQGWITLQNQSGTSFKDADTQLVAGHGQLQSADGNRTINQGLPPRAYQPPVAPCARRGPAAVRPRRRRLSDLSAAPSGPPSPRTRPSRSASSTPPAYRPPTRKYQYRADNFASLPTTRPERRGGGAVRQFKPGGGPGGAALPMRDHAGLHP